MWCLYDLPKSCHRTAQPLEQYLENKKINRIILFALYNYIISIKGLHFVTGFLVITINVEVHVLLLQIHVLVKHVLISKIYMPI